MKHDREGSDAVVTTRDGDGSPGLDDKVGATIRLWRAPNRIWPAFPTLVVARAASRLGRGRAQRRSPAIGEGGVTDVFLDSAKVGSISPGQVKVYKVSPGQHSLSLHFLGGLRRSSKTRALLAEGQEKQFVAFLNAFGWPSIRPATPNDVDTMNRLPSAAVEASQPG